jgi:hypothetical protein
VYLTNNFQKKNGEKINIKSSLASELHKNSQKHVVLCGGHESARNTSLRTHFITEKKKLFTT